jgi:hypothetical protein
VSQAKLSPGNAKTAQNKRRWAWLIVIPVMMATSVLMEELNLSVLPSTTAMAIQLTRLVSYVKTASTVLMVKQDTRKLPTAQLALMLSFVQLVVSLVIAPLVTSAWKELILTHQIQLLSKTRPILAPLVTTAVKVLRNQQNVLLLLLHMKKALNKNQNVRCVKQDIIVS